MVKHWLHFYFDPRGRATRQDYNLRGMLLILLGSVIASGVDRLVFADGHELFADIWSYIGVLLTVALTSRRLHDINVSGWWQAPFQLGTLAAMAWLDVNDIKIGKPEDVMPLMEKFDAIGGGIYLSVLAGLFVFLTFIIFIGTKHGTNGANKYGADPLQNETTQHGLHS